MKIIISFFFSISGCSSNLSLLITMLLSINGYNQNVAVVDSLNALAVSYAKKGDMNSASRIFIECYNEAEKTDNDTLKGRISHNLGNVFSLLHDFEMAEKYYSISLEKKSLLEDSVGILNLYINYAAMYEEQGAFNKALKYAHQSLELSKKIDNSRIKMILHNLGSIYGRMKQPENALTYYLKSFELQDRSANDRLTARSYCNIGVCYNDLGNGEQALEYLKRAQLIVEQQHYFDIKREVYWGIMQSYRLLQQHDSAWKYQEKWSEVKDSIYNSSLLNAVKELETKYETERKERENAELRALNAEQHLILEEKSTLFWLTIGGVLILVFGIIFLIMRNSIIAQKKEGKFIKEQAELEQQLLRSQMNPHFIFNAMNSIQRFILSNDQDSAYDYMEKFASLIRSILDNSSQKFISLKDELDTLKLYVEIESLRFEHKIQFDIQVDSEIDVISTKVPAMLIQPYIENAIWHGLIPKKKGGRIQINLLNKGSYLVCIIMDNGIGRKRSKELREKNNSIHKSVGLLKTKERLKLLFSQIGIPVDVKIEDMIDDTGLALGTKVVLQIPVA